MLLSQIWIFFCSRQRPKCTILYSQWPYVTQWFQRGILWMKQKFTTKLHLQVLSHIKLSFWYIFVIIPKFKIYLDITDVILFSFSLDERALVLAAKQFGYNFTTRTPESVTVDIVRKPRFVSRTFIAQNYFSVFGLGIVQFLVNSSDD